MTERDWMAKVIEAARWMGWLVYHTHDSRRSEAGFPDLVLVRDRVVYAELKSERGRLTPQQREWLDALGATGAEAYVWRPTDWDDVLACLRR